MFVLDEKKRDTVEIKVADDGNQKKRYDFPKFSRFPTLLTEYPIWATGIRHLIYEENLRKRVFRSKDILSIVENPISVRVFKLLHLLVAQKQQNLSLYARDVMYFVGQQSATALYRDFSKIVDEIDQVRLGYDFYDKSAIPKPWLEYFDAKSSKNKNRNNHFTVRKMKIISSVWESIRKSGKKRRVKIEIAGAIHKLIRNSKRYVTLESSVLQQISNRNSIELSIYMLCLRPQKINLREFLIPYLLGVSENTLLKVRDRKKVEVVRVQTYRIFKHSLAALEKMRDLRVIEDFKYEVTRIEIGGTGSAPFFSRLELKKSPSEKSKGGHSYE
jgi:hypothetical protein